MKLEMLNEATENLPERGLNCPALLVWPDGTRDRFEVFSCGCCITLDDCAERHLEGERVGTEFTAGGMTWRKVSS